MRVYTLFLIFVLHFSAPLGWAQNPQTSQPQVGEKNKEPELYPPGPSGLSDQDIAFQLTGVVQFAREVYGVRLSNEQISFIGDVLLAFHDGEATRRDEDTANVIWLSPTREDRQAQVQAIEFLVEYLEPTPHVEHMRLQHYLMLEPELFTQKLKEQRKRFAILDDIAELNIYAVNNQNQMAPGGANPAERAFEYAVHTMLLAPKKMTFFVIDQDGISLSVLHPKFRSVVTLAKKGRYMRTVCEQDLSKEKSKHN